MLLNVSLKFVYFVSNSVGLVFAKVESMVEEYICLNISRIWRMKLSHEKMQLNAKKNFKRLNVSLVITLKTH